MIVSRLRHLLDRFSCFNLVIESLIVDRKLKFLYVIVALSFNLVIESLIVDRKKAAAALASAPVVGFNLVIESLIVDRIDVLWVLS